jgi:prolyl oligopeptidase
VGPGRNAETAKVLEAGDFAALEKRILDILDSDARIPYVEKRGPFYYNFWRDAKNPRGLWRRTTLAEYRKESPAWETVIDLDALADAENENWVWHGADCLKPAYRRCLVQLSRGGRRRRRRARVRPRDEGLREGRLLPPRVEEQRRLARRDHLYVGTDFGPGSMTTSGYPRIAKVWKRGTPLAEAETVFEGEAEDVSVFALRDHTKGFERDFVHRRITFYSNEMFLRRDGKLVKIEKPDSANAERPPGPAPPRAAGRLDGRREDLPRRGAPRRGLRGLPEGRADASTCSSSPRRGSRSPASARRSTTSSSTSSTTSEPRLRADPQGREVDARAAPGHAGARHGERERRWTTRSRTTTS